MDVLCVGFGYVGKAYALLLRELGHDVDVLTAPDSTKQEADKYGYPYPMDSGKKYDACVIAVPTPTKSDGQDLSIIKTVLDVVNNRYKVRNIIIKSTILPSEIIKMKKKHKKKGQGFYLYPEFLEAHNPIGGVFNQTCCVFGKSGKWLPPHKYFIATTLFGLDAKNVTFTNLETASMLKYVHNIWLSCNVSFWNAMSRCINLQTIDYNLVLDETHKSKYFGIHPWHIGTSYGGECLPKDIKAFISSIKEESVFKKFIQSIDKVNEKVKT